MRFVSTRGQTHTDEGLSLSQALNQGLAPDGGLYVPERYPHFDITEFLDHPGALNDFASFAEKVLHPFFEHDDLGSELSSICRSAFDFPIPLRLLKNETAVLELFHGPTAAFKDVGARFLAECAVRDRSASGLKRTVIVATSGDTGGAVAAAFFGKPDIEVMVLYPKGKISARQEKQIAAWGGNVQAFAVKGTFDDCQKIVKEVLSSAQWRAQRNFISANSISIGRLLPQMTYYAHASLKYLQARNTKPGLIIPTGNLGNAVAALWAKRIGFPIREVILATNANRSIGDYFGSGAWKPNPTIATLANAMDVGNPSNMERLLHLYPDLNELKTDVHAFSVSDAELSNAIRGGLSAWGEVWCPHTATAAVAREWAKGKDWILVATAHPAKFETIVEPLIGETLEVPPALAAILNRESKSVEVEASLEALSRFL